MKDWAMKPYLMQEILDGEFIGDYQVLEILGRGSAGNCYHVLSSQLGKEFALKTLPLVDSLSLEWYDRLEAQTALLSKLASPHIDRVLNSGRFGHLWFCVKDFVHDGTGKMCNLHRYIQQFGGRLSHYQTYHLIQQIVTGLKAAADYHDAHHRGVHHGNLKLENVLIASTAPSGTNIPFEVRLSDFQPYGLFGSEQLQAFAHHYMLRLDRAPMEVRDRAVEMGLKGLYRGFDFLAPEISVGSMPTLAGDIWSVGVLTYLMLTGEFPAGRFGMVTEIRPELAAGWDDLICGALNPDPALRFTSYDQILALLKDELSEEIDSEDANRDSTAIDGMVSLAEYVEETKPVERRSLTPPGMVYIPAGGNRLGSLECGDDCAPQYDFTTAGFYIDRNPVTVGQYAKFVQETGYKTEVERGEGGAIWLDGQWKVIPGIHWRQPMERMPAGPFDRHPVTQLTYNDALAYCEWAGRRLPTEAEWEYAARGGQREMRFPWGNIPSRNYANFSTDGTEEVGLYPANGYGLFDMAGNVWEWTSSWYLPYVGNSIANPHYGEKYRVVRGGAWLYDASHCMVAFRNANQPDRSYPTLGFRTVVDFQGDKK